MENVFSESHRRYNKIGLCLLSIGLTDLHLSSPNNSLRAPRAYRDLSLNSLMNTQQALDVSQLQGHEIAFKATYEIVGCKSLLTPMSTSK
jgi:hypothetical protein